MKRSPPKIGIVSGIGPLAGSDVLAKTLKNACRLYGAVNDNEYPDLLLLNHGIEGVDEKGSLSDLFLHEITDMVQQLEKQGATIIGVACNTAHIYLPKIKVKAGTVLINLVDAVSYVASQNDHNYLLLTSSSTKQQKLYHSYLNRYGVRYSETSAKQQQLLDDVIRMVMAHRLNRAGEMLDEVLVSAKKTGFDAVIAGCTELPIALRHCKGSDGLLIIDSNDELAKALLKKYY